MDKRIITALVIATILVVSISLIAIGDSSYKLDQAYEQYINTPVVRNEWGQRRMTQEQMCSATIKQWMEICE